MQDQIPYRKQDNHIPLALSIISKTDQPPQQISTLRSVDLLRAACVKHEDSGLTRNCIGQGLNRYRY